MKISAVTHKVENAYKTVSDILLYTI